jgi:hypothetical protein
MTIIKILLFDYKVGIYKLFIMGLVKIMVFVSIPLTAMLVSSIKLGKLLPVAARQMGNTIGMGYVYFKVIIRNLKPKN